MNASPQLPPLHPPQRGHPLRYPTTVVQLHVEHLVLDGLPYDAPQSERLKASLATELSRLLQGNPAQASRIQAAARRPSVPSLHLPPGVSPDAAGRAFAHALLRSLSHPPTARDPAEDRSLNLPGPSVRNQPETPSVGAAALALPATSADASLPPR